MPITPFHFGPGVLLKASAPGHFSWTLFVLANVLIDTEPVLLFLLTGAPDHPWLHTPLGALLVALVAATLGRPVCAAWLRWWNRQLSPGQARWLGCGSRIDARAAWLSALLGSATHLALDMLMHADVRPGWPLLDGNPMFGAVGLEMLHGAALLSGAVGLLFLLLRRWRAR